MRNRRRECGVQEPEIKNFKVEVTSAWKNVTFIIDINFFHFLPLIFAKSVHVLPSSTQNAEAQRCMLPEYFLLHKMT
jgi:hypothetical protein